MDPGKKRRVEENGGIPEEEDPSLKLSPQDVRRLIEPFTHEQLAEIVQNAAIRHVDVLDAVRSIVDLDFTQRKLFIRGLGWETTADKIINAFSIHGEIEEAIVIMDKSTGKSRGYGFITFKHVDGAFLALKEPSKKIDGRMTVTQLAASGNTGQASSTQPTADVSMRKIYVGNVPIDMQPERLLSHFSTFGEIEEGPLGFDKQTGKSRGFALFVFKTIDSANAALVNPLKNLDGHQLMCKMAVDGKRKAISPAVLPQVGQIPVPGGDVGQIQTHIASHYAVPAAISPYAGYAGGGAAILGPSPLHQHPLQTTSLTTTGLLPASAPMQSTYSGVLGSSYGGTQYGHGVGEGSVSGVAGNTGSSVIPSGSSMLTSGGGISSLYSRLPTSGVVNPSPYGGETSHYSLSSSSGYSSAYSGQHNQPGASPVPRVLPSALYQGQPHYF